MTDDKLPPCPVCGSPIKVMVESEWTFSWRCQPDNAESWHVMWLNNRDEYVRLCELIEAGRKIAAIRQVVRYENDLGEFAKEVERIVEEDADDDRR